MEKFTQSNTTGYTDAQLHELNRRSAAWVHHLGLDEDDAEHFDAIQRVRKRIKAEYDAEYDGEIS